MDPDRSTHLRSLARRLEQLELASLVRSSTPDTWTGPTADAATAMLLRHRHALQQAVDQLRATARRLDQQPIS